MKILERIGRWLLTRNDVVHEDADGWDWGHFPSWASAEAYGNYRAMHAQLATRDGKAIGNAVVIDFKEDEESSLIRIVTDAGNLLWLTDSEIEQYFYPPEFIMAELMYAHKRAIIDAAKDQSDPESQLGEYKIGVQSPNTGQHFVLGFDTPEERAAFGYGVQLVTQMNGGSSETISDVNKEDFEQQFGMDKNKLN